MPKKITIEIKESIDFLEKLYFKTKAPLKRDRIKALLYVKEDKYHFQSNIATKLGRTEKTIREWLRKYSELGIEGLLQVSSGGNNTRTLSDSAIAYISEKVTDPSTTITSYIELQLLIKEEIGRAHV